MKPGDPKDLTGVLRAAREGDAGAEQLLYERVYGELQRIARGRLRLERGKLTLLQTGDLVQEAFLRLVREEGVTWENRNHFFGAAVEAMRRILVEYSRRRNAQRRGGGALKVTLEDNRAAEDPSFDVLALNEALDRLAGIRPRAAKVVGLRYLLGMTVNETADLLKVAPRTVDVDSRFANAWLRREIDAP